jgi:hypothetical protein
VTPFETARRALAVLASDAPWGERNYRAAQELKSLTAYSWFDPVIAEMIDEASDEDRMTPKERAKAVAEIIETIFRLCKE